MTAAEIIITALLGVCIFLLAVLLAARGRDRESALTEKKLNDAVSALKEENASQRKLLLDENANLRRELAESNARLEQSLRQSVTASDASQRDGLKTVSETMDRRLSDIQQTVLTGMNNMTQSNEQKLESIRVTVDEKLSATLNKRFAESFEAIGSRLDAVNKGLGEMQALASGVGDLKKVLTNVKTRGTWGEIQLGALLEQILSPVQYRANVRVKPRGGEIVEYAIVLPGKEEGQKQIYLPIDSKFPSESYQRLADAREAGDAAAQEAASKALCGDIRQNARTIRDKYIEPPYTTDFAIMYLPTEGLYSFAAADASLLETLQRDYRITVMGPATLGAFLNSLQMGFRTLAIQKQTGEVWKTVTQLKKDFTTFGDLLEKTQKKLNEASGTIDDAIKRTSLIQRRFDRIETPQEEQLAIGGEGAEQ